MMRGQAIGDAYVLPTPAGERVVRLSPGQRRDYQAYRLFAVCTRRLLRRRVWDYFDRLGRERPERYVPALGPALERYTDNDLRGEAMLDRWGLVHVLFRHSNMLVRRRGGWCLLPGRWLVEGVERWPVPAELPAAPAHDHLWARAPGVLFDLLKSAPARLIRHRAGSAAVEVGLRALPQRCAPRHGAVDPRGTREGLSVVP
jgi:hypothetical protein